MKKTIYFTTVLALTIILIGSGTAHASTITFTNNFGYGATGATVAQLQKFLSDEGYLKTTPNSKFDTQTKKALKNFQADQGVPQTGYFDVETMANANARVEVIAQKNIPVPATIAAQYISYPSAWNNLLATVFGAVSPNTITWKTNNYPKGAGVNINLIQKISDSPVSYNLVRTIALNIPNTGTYEWTPKKGESGNTFYVEITCAGISGALQNGCTNTSLPIQVQS